MSIEITAVHLEGGTNHQAITSFRWRNEQTGTTGQSDKPTMVKWIDEGNEANVADGAREVPVYTYHPTDGRQPWCQTKSDGDWSNNLLSLPRY